jgi:prepilin-type processing-associated H-X9-DG protein
MYSNESKGEKFPPNHNSDDHIGIDWMFPIQIPSGPAVYPNYLTDVNIMFCPSANVYCFWYSSIDDLTDCGTIEADGEPRGAFCQGNDWDDPGFVDPRPAGGIDAGKFWSGGGYEYCGWAGAENVETWITWQAWRTQVLTEGIVDTGGGQGSGAALDVDADTSLTDMGEWSGQAYDVYPPETFPSGFQNYAYPEEPVGNGGTIGGTIYRLREGIERFMITDINNPAGSAMGQSELPIFWDMAHRDWGDFTSYGTWNHVPSGGNVLFMDGHVEFHNYPAADIGPYHPAGIGQMT